MFVSQIGTYDLDLSLSLSSIEMGRSKYILVLLEYFRLYFPLLFHENFNSISYDPIVYFALAENLNPKSNAFKRQEAFFMGNKSQERLGESFDNPSLLCVAWEQLYYVIGTCLPLIQQRQLVKSIGF